MLVLPERVLARVSLDPATGCWLWTGAVSKGGYGVIRLGGRIVYVHRYVWRHLHGYWPPIVDHECHNLDETCSGGPCLHRRCCNPLDLREALSVPENSLRGNSPAARAHRAGTCTRGHSGPFRRKRDGRIAYCMKCRGEA